MQRDQLTVRRIVRPRIPPLLPCLPADGSPGCDTAAPFMATKPCPNCGKRLRRSGPPAPTPSSIIIDGDGAIIDADTEQVVAVQRVSAAHLANDLAAALRGIAWNGARKNIDGGWLHLADYDVYLTIPNGSISIFDGQSILHGVTPLRQTGPAPYRYTVVTYAKSGFKGCADTYAAEVRRGQLRATEMETARADRMAAK